MHCAQPANAAGTYCSNLAQPGLAPAARLLEQAALNVVIAQLANVQHAIAHAALDEEHVHCCLLPLRPRPSSRVHHLAMPRREQNLRIIHASPTLILYGTRKFGHAMGDNLLSMSR